MVRAYRSGLGLKDVFSLPTHDQSKESAARLQRLWDEEREAAAKANRESSFARAVFRFCATRIYIATFFMATAIVLQFIAPVGLLS